MSPFVELLRQVQQKSGATLAPIITTSSEKAQQLLPSSASPVLVSIRRRSSTSLNLNTRVSKVIVTVFATLFALFFVFFVHRCVLPRHVQPPLSVAPLPNARAGLKLLRDLPQERMPQPAIADGTRERKLLIVGDVHACADELLTLLNETAYLPGHDTLLLTGDLLSKGPAPLRTLALLRSLNATAVRGNHDDRLLAELARSHPAGIPPPRLAGGLTEADVAWLARMPAMLRLRRTRGPHTLVAHAGVVPGVPPEAQAASDVLEMRTVAPRRTRWSFSGPSTWAASWEKGGRPWYEVWEETQAGVTAEDGGVNAGPVRVVYGHYSAPDVQMWKWSLGLNTRCVTGGSLTALVMHGDGTEELVQVGCRKYAS